MTSIDVRARARGVSYQQLLDSDSKRGSRYPPSRGRVRRRGDVRPRRALHLARVLPARARQGVGPDLADGVPRGAPANVGDNIVYDVAGRSYLVVRSGPSTIQAFHNVCLHRGRLLRTEGGCRATEFRCPFHGFGWKIDGSLLNIPCVWTSPRWRTRPTRVSGRCRSARGAGSSSSTRTRRGVADVVRR